MAEAYSDGEIDSDEEVDLMTRRMKGSGLEADTELPLTKQSNPQLSSGLGSKVNFSALTPGESNVMSGQAQNRFLTSVRKQDDNRYERAGKKG